MLAWACGKSGCACGIPCEINVKIGPLAGTGENDKVYTDFHFNVRMEPRKRRDLADVDSFHLNEQIASSSLQT